jgi:hypothetical protein
VKRAELILRVAAELALQAQVEKAALDAVRRRCVRTTLRHHHTITHNYTQLHTSSSSNNNNNNNNNNTSTKGEPSTSTTRDTSIGAHVAPLSRDICVATRSSSQLRR